MTETALEVAFNILSNIEDTDDRLYYLNSISDRADLRYQVMSFHKMYESSIKESVTTNLQDVSDKEIAMRINLVAEEFREWLDAFGVDYKLEFFAVEETEHEIGGSRTEIIGSSDSVPERWVPSFRDKIDVVEIADASADLKYVLEGSDITFGINSRRVSQEVHASNMTKLGEDGKPIFRDDGKILKGPSYVKPNIAKAMNYEV